MLAKQGACEQTGDLPVAVLEGVDDEKVEDKQARQEHRVMLGPRGASW